MSTKITYLTDDDEALERLKKYIVDENNKLTLGLPYGSKNHWIYKCVLDEKNQKIAPLFCRATKGKITIEETACYKFKIVENKKEYVRFILYDAIKNDIKVIKYKDVCSYFELEVPQQTDTNFFRLINDPVSEGEKSYVYSYTIEYGDTIEENGRVFLPKTWINKNKDGWFIPQWLYDQKVHEIKLGTGYSNPEAIENYEDSIKITNFVEIPNTSNSDLESTPESREIA